MHFTLPPKPPLANELPLDSEGYRRGYTAGSKGRKCDPESVPVIQRDSYIVGFEAAKRAIRLELDERIETTTVRRVRIKR